MDIRAISVAVLLASVSALADDAAPPATVAPVTATAMATEATAQDSGDGVEAPKTMSGMSILGNEEAPKSLVIIPWQASELGEDISLADTLDERARPVDMEVFLRELSFYAIRSGE